MSVISLLALVIAMIVAANLVLGRLPAPPEDGGGIVETAAGPIHYVETVGEGPPVVFIHGMPGSCREFDLVRAALPGRHTIAFDRPGYAWSKGPPCDFATQIDSLVEAAGTLGIDRAILVGHSFGGMAVLGMAIRHERFARGLLLLAPAAGGSRLGESTIRQARMIRRIEMPVVRQISDLLFLRLLRRHASRLRAADVYGEAPERDLQRHVAESMIARHNSIRALANDRLLFNDAERTVSKGLSRITAPVVILHGENDPMVPSRNARRLNEAILGSELIEIPGDHHLPTKNVDDVISAFRALEAR